MSKIGTVIALTGGGLAVSAMTYVGVASIQGANVREMPPLSWVVRPAPAPDPAKNPPPVAPAPEPRVQAAVVPPMTAGVLGAFVMPSPFDSRELQDLQTKLGERLAQVEAREQELIRRAGELDDWQRTLEDRALELTELRAAVEGAQGSSPTTPGDARKPEAGQAVDSGDPASWRALAPLFEEGDADELALKLAEFEPDEAAQILAGLEPERAAALLNALPAASYKPFLDAWRRARD